MKKELPCIYIPTAPLLSHHLLQSWGSLGCPLSSYTPLSTALIYKKWVFCKPFLSQFQPLWSKMNKGERRPQPYRWLFLAQRRNLENLSSGRTLSSAERPCAPGEGWQARRSRGTGPRRWASRCSPVHTYFHQSTLGRRQRVKGCPVKLSCALGPNSISQ